MKTAIKAAATVGLFVLTLLPGCAQRQADETNLRLLYWNIQNGMWSGQGDNYTRFVDWVSAQNPDVCVWCEAVSNYRTASDEKVKPEEAYLPEHWGELARRYGHEYWYKGGHRDNFPQVITSKYPIENVARLIGAVPDSIVSHGAGWAQIRKNGHTLNIVSLHTWPQVYGFGLTDKQERKASAEGFYKVMKMMGADVVFNHADYRLMSRRALDGLESFKEVNMFLRGVVPMIGYKSDKVYYARKERFAGTSKYPLKKMLSFAWEGITSLSTKPIALITRLGTLIFLVSIIMLIYSFVRHCMGATITGWTSLIVSIWAIGGLQLLAIGVIGQYIGKVYLETRERPKFIIETYLSDEDADADKDKTQK